MRAAIAQRSSATLLAFAIACSLSSGACLGADETAAARTGAQAKQPSVPPRSIYFVTVSFSATTAQISGLRSATEQVSGAGTESRQLSRIMYEWRFAHPLPTEATFAVEGALRESPIVCGYCAEGSGCITSVMDKPGCR